MTNQRSLVATRELEVVKCIAKGLTSDEIGAELGITKRTVDAHRRNVMIKLKAENSSHLISICYKENLLKL